MKTGESVVERFYKVDLLQLFPPYSTFMKEHMELDLYDFRVRNLGRFEFFSMRAGKPVVEWPRKINLLQLLAAHSTFRESELK